LIAISTYIILSQQAIYHKRRRLTPQLQFGVASSAILSHCSAWKLALRRPQLSSGATLVVMAGLSKNGGDTPLIGAGWSAAVPGSFMSK
jgi:hypothetical protein